MKPEWLKIQNENKWQILEKATPQSVYRVIGTFYDQNYASIMLNGLEEEWGWINTDYDFADEKLRLIEARYGVQR